MEKLPHDGEDEAQGGCGPGCSHETDDTYHLGGGDSANKRKKKKGKKKGSKGGAGGAAEEEEEEELTPEQEQQLMERQMASMMLNPDGTQRLTEQGLYRMLQEDMMMRTMRGTRDHKPMEEYKFWSTQPVPSLDDSPNEDGPIDVIKSTSDVRQEPYKIPEGFEWCEVDIKDPTEVAEVYDLLNRNYVEDDDNMFRFDYSPEFLKWALTPPGTPPEFVVGIRATKGKKLVGFITGVPVHLKVYGKGINMVEINFLCVHKKLRSKRLAPVLIKEITRRVNLTNVWQAVYTAGVVLPKPVSRCRYFHRLLDPKKLINIGFTRLQPRMSINMTVKLYRLPERPTTAISEMTPEDVPSARALLSTYLERFSLAPEMTEEEFAHWLLPRPGVINSYVIRDERGNVTDMCSFYHLTSSVIKNDQHPKLYAVYSFYNVATTMPLKQLMKEALILAKGLNADVFNALNIMDNRDFLEELKFGQGDGNLQYYLYNWKCPDVPSEKVGLVLL